MKFFKDNIVNLNFYLNKKFKKKFFIIFLLTLFASLIELIGVASLPLLVGIFFENSISPNLIELQSITKIENPLMFISVIILFIFIFKNLFLAYAYFVENKFGRDLSVFLKDKLHQGYLSLPFKYYLNDNPSTFTRNILDDTQNISWYFNVLILFLREIITVLFITSYLIYSDYKTTLSLILFLSSISFLFYFSLKNKISNFSKNDLMYRKYQLKSLTQTFETIEIIKILNKYNFFKNKFREYTDLKEKYNFYINYLNRLPRLILELSAIFVIVYVILKFSQNNFDNKDFISYLTLLVVCIIRFIPAFTSITNSMVIMRKVNVSVERVKKIINLINDNNIKNNINPVNKNFNSGKNKIEVKNIDFAYQEDKKKILNNLSLTIENKDNIALVGSSGNGKSTLVKILLGLLKPTKGSVFYNSNDIYQNLESWHKKIGYIPQKIYLHDESIKNNIAFGIEDSAIDHNKLDKVIKLSNLDAFINNLPEGINTNVGNQGSNISGGQLQRIGIARVLYASPEILIMDEATNSLDEATEKKVIESINNIDQVKIKIIISHRQSTVESCNKIYLLESGNIKKIK